MTPEEIVRDPEGLAELAREYDLALVILFGSRVTGHTHAESDTDIGVLRREGLIPSKRFFELEFRLSQVIHLVGEIQMVDLRRASGLLRHNAARNAMVLYEAMPGVLNSFRSLAWRLYHDEALDFRRHDSQYIRRAVAELMK